MEDRDKDEGLMFEKEKEDDQTLVSVQTGQRRENMQTSATKRPNIDEISKRNEEAARQERKSSYKVVGIIVFLILAFMFLVYFFG